MLIALGRFLRQGEALAKLNCELAAVVRVFFHPESGFQVVLTRSGVCMDRLQRNIPNA